MIRNNQSMNANIAIWRLHQERLREERAKQDQREAEAAEARRLSREKQKEKFDQLLRIMGERT